jgi:hypothetical protein
MQRNSEISRAIFPPNLIKTKIMDKGPLKARHKCQLVYLILLVNNKWNILFLPLIFLIGGN